MPAYNSVSYGGAAVARDRTRGVFGQVMGLVALAVAFAALGAYIGRDVNAGIALFIPVIAAVFGMQWAVRRGREQLAIGLLFAMGLVLGIAVGGVIHYYSETQPDALYQAAGSTALFTGALGAYGYTTRRDLSAWVKPLMFALIGLIIVGLVTLFIAIPGGNIIYCVLGLVVFGALTVFDFNRLQRAGMQSSVLIAASIFLDVFNIFLFMLSLFGGGGGRR